MKDKNELIFTDSRARSIQPLSVNGICELVMRRVKKSGLREENGSRVNTLSKFFFTNWLAAGIYRGVFEKWM